MFQLRQTLSSSCLYPIDWWRTTHGELKWVSSPQLFQWINPTKIPFITGVITCYNPLTSRGMSHQVSLKDPPHFSQQHLKPWFYQGLTLWSFDITWHIIYSIWRQHDVFNIVNILGTSSTVVYQSVYMGVSHK